MEIVCVLFDVVVAEVVVVSVWFHLRIPIAYRHYIHTLF